VRQDKNDPSLPVVHPLAGSDVYLAASRWQWRPLIELEKGKSYHLHISSLDWDHGFSLQPGCQPGIHKGVVVHDEHESRTVSNVPENATQPMGSCRISGQCELSMNAL